jgi:hypothetical protein
MKSGPKGRAPAEYLYVRATAQDLGLGRVTWAGISKLIGEVPAPHVLDVVGRLTSHLYVSTTEELESQRAMLRVLGLDGLVPRFDRTIAKLHTEGIAGAVAIDMHRCYLLLRATAELDLKEENHPKVDARRIGYALIGVGDLVRDHLKGPAAGADDPGLIAWTYYMFTTAFVTRNDWPLAAIARAWHFYFAGDTSATAALATALRAALPVAPATWWSVMFYLRSLLSIPSASALEGRPAGTSIDEMFGTSAEVVRDEVSAVLSTVAQTYAEYQATMRGFGPVAEEERTAYRLGDLHRRPLVRIGEKFYAPWYPALSRAIVDLPFFIALGSLPDKAAKEGLFQSLGTAFEAYCGDLVPRTYVRPPSRTKPWYFRLEAVSVKHDTKKIADLVIVHRDIVWVVECKGRRFTEAVSSGIGGDDFDRILDDVILRGSAQLASTIEQLRGGSLWPPGTPLKKWRFIPIVVLLQGFPWFPPWPSVVAERLKAKALLQDPDTEALQVLDIDEWEALMTVWHASTEPLALFDLKHEAAPQLSWHNWIAGQGMLQADSHHPLLRQIFKSAGLAAAEWAGGVGGAVSDKQGAS